MNARVDPDRYADDVWRQIGEVDTQSQVHAMYPGHVLRAGM